MNEAVEDFIVPITLVVLVLLFLVQSRGTAAVGNQSRRAVFTQEQDEAFHKEPGLYAFLANIFWRDKTLIDLKREYGLTDASCYLYLRKLEKLGILQLGIDNSYHFIMIDQFDRFMQEVNTFLG